MGVRGLATYIEGNRRHFQDVKFRDSRLVIDGCNVYNLLYFTHVVDQTHGGDYDDFFDLVSKFFSALAECSIQPYVVLDGGMDPSDKKFSTLKRRLQSRIKEANDQSIGGKSKVLPFLARDVFIQVLTQRGVPYVRCPTEADQEMACLAHQWHCPVLTRDSDFYIFDLPGGCLPFGFFQWTDLNGEDDNRYIPARLYTTDGLCRWFGGMNRELLPLLAVLVGNDYVTPEETGMLLAMLDLGGQEGPGRIEALLDWLSSFTGPEEALNKVEGLMGEGTLVSSLTLAVQEYHLNSRSSLARWFSEENALPGGRNAWPVSLPDDLCCAVARGQLSPMVLDVLQLKRVFLKPQVENSKLASSHTCATAIRQAIYGILLHRRGPGMDSQGQERESSIGRAASHCSQVQQSITGGPGHGESAGAPLFVEEYDRLELNLKRNQVEVYPPTTPLWLDTLCQAPLRGRLGALLEVLGVRESALASVPPHLRLIVGVTGFWMREAVPAPSPPKVQALLLGLVYGELGWNDLHSEHHIRVGIERHRVIPWRSQGLEVGVAHSFSQWQACLSAALCLNQLLLMPLPEPKLPWVFSGSLLHGLFRCLAAGRPAQSFLPGGSFSEELYRKLLDAVNNCSLTPAGGAEAGVEGEGEEGVGGVEEVNNRFAHLMRGEESEEDE